MSAPYNPAPGGQQPGDQPSWGGYSGGNYPQQNQPGYGGSDEYQQGGYGQSGYSQPGGYQYGEYQQGGYQQANYPQQPSGYGYGQGYGGYGSYSSQPRQTIGIVGLVVAFVGAIVLISGFFLNWYSADGGHLKFSDIHKTLDGPGAPGLPKAYFGWLAWVLLALVIIAAVVANLPIGSASLPMRIAAPVIGLLGLLLTLLALNSYWDKVKDVNGGGDVGIFKHSAIGLYLTLAGFIIAGVAGVFGPRRA
ncbi:MAG TPA: hypothetical protein VH373_15030 [Jatrophihabitantaceae bacterium]|jgi:hypothetical protein